MTQFSRLPTFSWQKTALTVPRFGWNYARLGVVLGIDAIFYAWAELEPVSYVS